RKVRCDDRRGAEAGGRAVRPLARWLRLRAESRQATAKRITVSALRTLRSSRPAREAKQRLSRGGERESRASGVQFRLAPTPPARLRPANGHSPMRHQERGYSIETARRLLLAELAAANMESARGQRTRLCLTARP